MRVRLVLASLLAVAGCSSEKPAHHSRVQTEPTGPLTLHMRNCPSAVPSARTATPRRRRPRVSTSRSSFSRMLRRAPILALTQVQTTQHAPLAGLPMASERTPGPARSAIVRSSASERNLTYEQIPDGVRVHVTARSQDDIALIQRATQARVRRCRSRRANDSSACVARSASSRGRRRARCRRRDRRAPRRRSPATRPRGHRGHSTTAARCRAWCLTNASPPIS